MATRFYFPSSGSPPVTPTMNNGGEWDHVNGTNRLPFHRSPVAASPTALGNTAYTPDAADHHVDGDSLLAQLVGVDKLAAQTINAQTVSWQWQCSEPNNGNNQFLTLKIFLVSEDGSTIKETLLDIQRDATEMVTTITNRSDSATIASATVEEGDRLCIEIGCGGTPTAAGGVNGHNCSIRFGEDASSGDLPVDNTTTTTTFRPWLEFAEDLEFQGEPVPEASDGDWWAGAFQCAAGIAASAALAASALTAQIAGRPFDDQVIVEQPAPSQGGVVSSRTPTRILYNFSGDEIPSIPPHEISAAVYPVPQLWPTSRQAFSADEEVVPEPAPPFGLDEDYWQPLPLTAWPRPSVQAFTADDEITQTPPALTPDEDFWQRPVLIDGSLRLALPWWNHQDEAPEQPVPSQGGAVSSRTPTRILYQFSGEDLPIPAAPLPVDEAYWLLGGPRPVTWLPFIPAFSATDEWPTPVVVTPVDEDPWPLPAHKPGVLFFPAPWDFGDDDSTVEPEAALTVDEAYWQNPVRPVTWAPSVQAIRDSGMDMGNLHTFPAVDEDFPGPLPKPRLWPTNGLLVWGEPSDWVTAPTFINTDEDFHVLDLLPAPKLWLVPPVQAVTDDGNNIGNLHTFPAVDEDFPGPLPKPQLWPTNGLLLWGDPAERIAPQLYTDEDFPGPFPRPRLWPVPPVQAITDEDLIVATISVQEDYWINWVKPLPGSMRWVDPSTWEQHDWWGGGLPVIQTGLFGSDRSRNLYVAVDRSGGRYIAIDRSRPLLKSNDESMEP